jgi:hypothetical protein
MVLAKQSFMSFLSNSISLYTKRESGGGNQKIRIYVGELSLEILATTHTQLAKQRCNVTRRYSNGTEAFDKVVLNNPD